MVDYARLWPGSLHKAEKNICHHIDRVSLPPHLHFFKKWVISNIYFDMIKFGQKMQFSFLNVKKLKPHGFEDF